MNNFIPVVNHSLKYNPSIDGLRGIAIFLVLIFHIWPNYFSFGYVGVDIFFVLSGYLITQIIYTKLENGNFSLKEFYRNRIRRIFPALILVLLSSLIFAYLFLFPSEFENLSKHIKSSAFFYQNFRLINEVGYWDEAAILKPLLHFWSLAIEEQFYLFWPLLFMFLYKIRLNMVLSIFIVFLILFALAIILDIDKFYHSISRTWELALGGLVFVLSYKYKDLSEFLRKNKYPIYIIFFISILFSCNNKSFDIIKTFLVVFSSALLILSLSYDKTKTIFSNKILVFIGIISFPLYLWHYVIISFSYIVGYEINDVGIYIAILSIFLSYLTYRYVELYSRKKDSYFFTIVLISIVLIIVVIANYISKNKGLEDRSHFPIINKEFEKQFIRTLPQNDLGISLITKVLGYKPNNDYIKSTSNELNKKFILIIGDSHAHTSYPGFEQYASKYNYETILLANSSCPPYLNGEMGKDIKDLKECKNKIENIYKLINSDINIEKVILTTRMGYMYDVGFGTIENSGKNWNYHYEDFFKYSNNYNQKKEFFNVVERTFEYFGNNKKIEFYYLIDNPELGFSPKSCMLRPFDLFPIKCTLSLERYLNRSGEYIEFINELSKKYKDVNILNPRNIYCDDKFCYAVKNNKMLYSDDNHHSIDGSIEQAKYFESIIFGENGVK